MHDSQMIPLLLDPENQDDYVWADSAYSGQRFKDLLSLGGFESRIHEKGHFITLLARRQKSTIPLRRQFVLE